MSDSLNVKCVHFFKAVIMENVKGILLDKALTWAIKKLKEADYAEPSCFSRIARASVVLCCCSDRS